MNGTNDTNAIVTGSGTASDPYIFNIHATSETAMIPHFMFYAVLIVVAFLAFVAAGGFMLGFYFGKRQKKSD
ncbi:MAG TPA: hypothetical protein VGR14_03385 [Verrucomicrobiae bacterium]|jgi:hypothetical protein|nr:hypothetical protein [Verrucomicrobiae bacterium]